MDFDEIFWRGGACSGTNRLDFDGNPITPFPVLPQLFLPRNGVSVKKQ